MIWGCWLLGVLACVMGVSVVWMVVASRLGLMGCPLTGHPPLTSLRSSTSLSCAAELAREAQQGFPVSNAPNPI